MSRLPLALLAVSSLAACSAFGDASGERQQEVAEATTPSRSVDRQARTRIVREDMLTQMAFWAGEYQTFPNDLEAAQRFAEALRRGGRQDRAAQVASEALNRFPQDGALLTTYGLAQLGQRQPQEALRPLAMVAAADAQNWRARSALGAALDQLGRYQEARQAYEEALAIQPNDPRILTNLGVSHILAGEAEEAETVLRQASAIQGAPPETRQNLAIALALLGRFQEAEQLLRVDLSPQEAAQNAAYLRSLRSDPRRWGDIGR